MSDTKSIIYDAAVVRLRRNYPDAQAVLLANMVVAQAAHETGGFTSNVFKRNNNICGYKPYAGSLYQVAQTQSSVPAYGNYKSVADCARELADWIARRTSSFGNVKTVAGYAQALKANSFYEATVSQYIAGMEFFVKAYALDFGKILKSGNLSSFGTVVVVGVLGYLAYLIAR